MHGVSRISTDENILLISFSDADAQFMADVLNQLAQAGVVVDMISQTAPYGSKIRFSFTASFSFFDTALKTIGAAGQSQGLSPMISGGYSKLNLYGEEMVDSVGVAAKALVALNQEKVEISMITTSDLDISILVRTEDTDVAGAALKKVFALT